jgi:O-antigen ligase
LRWPTSSLLAPGRILIAVIAVALLIAAQLALHRIQARLASEAAVDARVPFARNTIEAALAYMPYGSGLGSFVPVYQRFEKATDNVSDVYANHAHNDFLELWLETGVIGLAAMAIFALWLAVSAVRVWRRGLPGARYSDNLLAAASALSLALLLAHSMVDYPLRATALMVYFAFAAGMIVAPAGARQPLVTVSGAAAARDTEERPASGPSRPFVPAQRPPNDWPDAWRASPRRRNDDM